MKFGQHSIDAIEVVNFVGNDVYISMRRQTAVNEYIPTFKAVRLHIEEYHRLLLQKLCELDNIIQERKKLESVGIEKYYTGSEDGN